MLYGLTKEICHHIFMRLSIRPTLKTLCLNFMNFKISSQIFIVANAHRKNEFDDKIKAQS